MESIEYFKNMREKMCEEYLKIIPKGSVAYYATLKEKSFYDEAIEALEQTRQKVRIRNDSNNPM